MKKPLDDPAALTEFLFSKKPNFYQKHILDTIFVKKKKRTTIRSPTRAGKSWIMSKAAILGATFKNDYKVDILGANTDKTQPIMNYIADDLAINQMFDDIVMVDTKALTRLERLRKEVSKKKITFRNGSHIEIKSADLTKKEKGMGFMGWGYNLIIIDETSLLPKEAFSKAYRMLVDSPDSQIVEIGNPWFLGHFYDHHHADNWYKIHIDWEDCVKAGRMTYEDVMDQKRELTDLEFKILYDADFPEELEFALFSKEAIENCIKEREVPKISRYLIGIDVARGGKDRTVITLIGVSGSIYYYLKHIEMDTKDIMTIVGKTRELLDGYNKDNCFIAVDAIGVGVGVKDRLSELNYHCTGFVAGVKARNSKRYINKKSETIFKISEMMKEGKVFNIPSNSRYTLELRSWIYEIKSDRQLRVVDPDRSPDYGDSLMLALSGEIYRDEPLILGKTDVYRRPHRDAIIRGIKRTRRF